jgi:superfamily II DNA or RNA helicase
MINLLPFQHAPATHLRDIMERERISINASDTGTGKTYVGLHLIEEANRPTFIICPKAVIPNWERLAPKTVRHITNIEKLKGGRTKYLGKSPTGKTYTWNLPPRSLVLVDEAHSFGGQDSLNAYALAYLKTVPDVHVHLMSATLADSPARFRAFGFLMGLHNFVHFDQWAMSRGCFRDQYGNLRFTRNPNMNDGPMAALHREIFPRFGVRMRIKDIPDFPQNTIKTVLTSYIGTPKYRKEVEEYMRNLDDDSLVAEFGDWAYERVKVKPTDNAMVRLLRERQEAELLKLPYLRDEILSLLEEGRSVPVFLNFKYSIKILVSMLRVPSVLVTGDMNQTEREESKQLFQTNQVHVLIATHGAGGTGIDLHDLNGRPRTSLVSPCFHTVQFRQTLGRIHRAGALSPSIQLVVCQEDTTEEMVLKTLDRKLKNLDTLNDGDLQNE